ncbi:dUTP diphosphatase [Bacillus pseudomycoides]|uniref:dUTP diphosphatase n=2 Tax=Bacillus pseudomycoides TaxID=64104 RepID=UPI000BED1B29|nr:dUTP diphosphatase [Bacillus pseudomycoides]PED73023.1 dUTP diphosphatase [Bacillus pseudomycoides]PFW79988.1 dUTP diphosphatase [Bacillus pseudomycoides]PHE37484.1 dUTP diphosphatase [Bacillus pseudomycoides]
MKLRVKIKRVKDVELPRYAREFDAGFDLVAAEDAVIYPGGTKVIPTGLAFEIPPGYELQVRPRSGISRKTFLRVVLGTVDSGFRGEVGVIVSNTSYPGNPITLGINDDNGIYMNVKYEIKKGDRLAQGVIAPVETAHFVEVDKLSESERGAGGFGSTGVK